MMKPPRLRREAGGSENRGFGISHNSLEKWVYHHYHLRHTIIRFLNYLICWSSNERIKIAPIRGLYNVHIFPPSEQYPKELLKTHEGPKLVNRENKDASANAGSFSTNPVWNSNQKSSSQINDKSIHFSNVAQLLCNKLYVCTSHFHADGQIAKDCVDFQLETLIPVRMALQRQGSPCHLPCSPNHGLYSKIWETGKGVSVTRMYYAHACLKLPKNKSKKKVCFKKKILN